MSLPGTACPELSSVKQSRTVHSSDAKDYFFEKDMADKATDKAQSAMKSGGDSLKKQGDKLKDAGR